MLPDKYSIREIKDFLISLDEKDQQSYLNLLYNDKRKSIQDLVQKYQLVLAKKSAEKQRLQKMWDFEGELYQQNYKYIVGIDEVGRGPLAGPVVAGAVILPPYCSIEGLNDSKKINKNARKLIAEEIKAQALAWAVGVVDAQTIDELNILEATRYAMFLAVCSLGSLPKYALVDGQKNPLLNIPQLGIIRGDSLSASIAAASILAKVYRDKIMDTYDYFYPGYLFAINKGYGTYQHIQALLSIGPCPIHRKSFAPIRQKAQNVL